MLKIIQRGTITVAMLKMIDEPYGEVLNYLRRFDVDVNPKTMGINEATFIKCMQKGSSMRKGRYTHLDEVNLSEEKLSKLYLELVEEL